MTSTPAPAEVPPVNSKCLRCGQRFYSHDPCADVETNLLCGTCSVWDELFS